MTPQDERCASTLRAERRWVAADQVPVGPGGLALARSVNRHVRRTGKHFLPERMLMRLAEMRDRNAADAACPPFLGAFLDCLLDGHENRFRTRTYLSLPVLELLLDERNPAPSAERMSTLLMADVIRFESGAAGGSREGPARGRPDAETAATRLRHALRFVAQAVGGPGAGDGPPSRVDLPRPPATGAWAWFDVTVQPVYVLHDEYLFIRVLQAREMLFTAMAEHAKSTVAALRAGRPGEGARRVDDAVAMCERISGLLRTAATVRADHLSAIRHYSQGPGAGAGAVPSEQYARFEALCGALPAITRAPTVRAEAEARDTGHDTVTRAYLDLRSERGSGGAAWDRLDAALGRLERGRRLLAEASVPGWGPARG